MAIIKCKDKKIFDERLALSVKCKCGHTVFLPSFIQKRICTYCGVYVYKNPKEEYLDRLKAKLTKNK